jgi:type I restriction enzyme R subunit
MGWELTDVERPFTEQLQTLGWQATSGSLDDPLATARTSFKEVIHEAVLRDRLLGPTLAGRPAPVKGRGCHHPPSVLFYS